MYVLKDLSHAYEIAQNHVKIGKNFAKNQSKAHIPTGENSEK